MIPEIYQKSPVFYQKIPILYKRALYSIKWAQCLLSKEPYILWKEPWRIPESSLYVRCNFVFRNWARQDALYIKMCIKRALHFIKRALYFSIYWFWVWTMSIKRALYSIERALYLIYDFVCRIWGSKEPYKKKPYILSYEPLSLSLSIYIYIYIYIYTYMYIYIYI